ncbi:MAG: hypothetical protein GXP62_04925, partial [Oligoflexia bacterium]|nr:hypothetical protein [Oligoflexia bacterium]
MSPAITLLALLLSPPAQADQLVSGDNIRIYYDGTGHWNAAAAGLGLQYNFSGTWVDYTYPGSPYAMWSVEFTYAGTAYQHYTHNSYGTTMTVVSESDDSTSSVAKSTYQMTAGPLSIVKSEEWDITGSVILVRFQITNTGSSDVSDLRWMQATDPDQDAWTYGSYSTYIDTRDVTGDGTADWVEARGPSSGRTIGFGSCDPANSTMGGFGSWSYVVDADQTLSDYGGTSYDYAIGLRYQEPAAIAPGATVVSSFLVVLAGDYSTARADYLANLGKCDLCDDDGDGVNGADCGGSDCDDTDATIYPGAVDAWYDGIDSDCAGDNDYDADVDGYDSSAYGGTDCDDTVATTYPGAADAWYDGVDSDCAGNDDYDADGDGHDSSTYGGDDCDDTNPTIYTGATDTWYDGVDSDCAGNDDYDADGDGHDSNAYGGDDCD